VGGYVCVFVAVFVAFFVAVQLLLAQKKIASKFVEDNYEEFFAKFLNILKSKNNLTKRQLLRLLAREFSKVPIQSLKKGGCLFSKKKR